MCSTTIIEFPGFTAADIFRNYFFMARRMCVQPSLLARLATVLVWQRAVNRQPGSRARTRMAGARPAIIFQKIRKFSKNLTIFRLF